VRAAAFLSRPGYGVREYWLVDARRRTITVIARNADGRLGSERNDEPVHSVLLPGFTVHPSEIFPQATSASRMR
jgi:Uma2 family endonuclease